MLRKECDLRPGTSSASTHQVFFFFLVSDFQIQPTSHANPENLADTKKGPKLHFEFSGSMTWTLGPVHCTMFAGFVAVMAPSQTWRHHRKASADANVRWTGELVRFKSCNVQTSYEWKKFDQRRDEFDQSSNKHAALPLEILTRNCHGWLCIPFFCSPDLLLSFALRAEQWPKATGWRGMDQKWRGTYSSGNNLTV